MNSDVIDYCNAIEREFKNFLKSDDPRTPDEFLLEKILMEQDSSEWLVFARKFKYGRTDADQKVIDWIINGGK